MSSKTIAQRNARRLQRLAEDEFGIPPKLRICHDILRDTPRNPLLTLEEQLAAVFLAHRETLRTSAVIKASYKEDAKQ